jgi:glycosyltransferase involved in cell wall biosynthesis
MRLLFLSNLYPPLEIGGYEQWCHEVALRLRRRGHTVHVLTGRHGLNGTPPPEEDVSRTLYLQADVNHYHPSDFFLRRAYHEHSNQQELRRAIGQLDPDLMVVWGMWDLSRSLPFWAEQWMPGRVAYYISSYWPSDVDIHQEYWRLPARRPTIELLKKPLRRLALSQLRREGYPPKLRFEHAVCCSQYVRDTLVQANKLPAGAAVLFGGIDPEPFLQGTGTNDKIENAPLRLLYFGSLLPHKGVHTILEALGLLRQRGLADRIALTILGNGHPAYEVKLQALATRLRIDESVHFAGRVSRDEIPFRLRGFDIFLFTSIWPEPMARTVMEAMAAGKLVIGSEVGGQMEMLTNGENSLTFQAEDAEALASHIECVLDEPGLRFRLARAGQAMVLKRFTLQRMVDDIEAWLTSITHENPTG